MGGKSKQTTVATSAPPAFIQPSLNRLTQRAEDLFQQGPNEFFPGQPIVPFNPTQTAGQRGALGFATGPGQSVVNVGLAGLGSALSQGQNNTVGQVGQALAPGLVNAVGSSFNPAQLPNASGALAQKLSGNVDLRSFAPALASAGSRIGQQLDLNVLPGIDQNAVAGGQFGGTRQGIAEGVARGLAAQGLTNVGRDLLSQALDRANTQQLQAANLVEQSRLAGQGQALQGANLAGNLLTAGTGLNRDFLNLALGSAPSVFGLGLAPSQVQGDVGLAQQQQEQAQRNAEIQRFLFEQSAPFQQLQQFQSVIQPLAGAGGTSTQTAPGPSGAGQFLQGGLGTGIGAFALNSNPYTSALLGLGGGLASIL